MFAAGGPHPRRGLGRQGLAGAVGRPARAGLPSRRAVPGPRDRGVLGPVPRRSPARSRRIAVRRWSTVDLRERARVRHPDSPGRTGSRSTCAVCGLSKRYVFNKRGARGRLRRDRDRPQPGRRGRHAARQHPSVERRVHRAPVARPAGGDGLARKVKPLYRLSELETAAYAFLRGIDYVVEECPLVAGNTQLRYKEAMNAHRVALAGHEGAVLPRVPRSRAAPVRTEQRRVDAHACASDCGQPTTGPFCAFCRARAQILGERLGEPPRGRREVVAELADEVLPAEIYAGERA